MSLKLALQQLLNKTDQMPQPEKEAEVLILPQNEVKMR